MAEYTFEKGSLLTRASLLFRLRDWRDDVSWSEFYRLYHKLVYGLARRTGLSHAEAEDISQDVFKRVSETIEQFESNPQRGSFRGWLMNLTRWRVMDRYRVRQREVHHMAFDNGSEGRSTGEGSGNSIENIADVSKDNDQTTELEWKENVIAMALERLGKRISHRHMQVFDLYTRQHWPVLKVAKALGVNPATVYVIGHRLTKELKEEVNRIQRQLG